MDALGLADLTRIEVYTRTDAAFVHAADVTDRARLDAFLEAFGTPMKLGPRVRCPDGYHLHLILPDGSRSVLGIVCGGPEFFIRGAQPAWASQDGRATGQAVAVLSQLLPATPPASLAADAVVPEAARRALEQLDGSAATSGAYATSDWRRVLLEPASMPGAPERWRYATADVIVDVGWSATADPVFEVEVAIPSAGLLWKGRGQAGRIEPAP